MSFNFEKSLPFFFLFISLCCSEPLTMTVQKTKSSEPFDLNMESRTFLWMFSRKTTSPAARDSGRRRVNHLAHFCYASTVLPIQVDSKQVCR